VTSTHDLIVAGMFSAQSCFPPTILRPPANHNDMSSWGAIRGWDHVVFPPALAYLRYRTFPPSTRVTDI
jgi:hypothetical protein